jgi:hypothetical protein
MRARLLIAALAVVSGFALFALYRPVGRQASGNDHGEVDKLSLAPPDGRVIVPSRPGDQRTVDHAPLAPLIDLDLLGLTIESLKLEMTKRVIKKDVSALTKWLAATGVRVDSFDNLDSFDIGGARVYERVGLERSAVASYLFVTFSEAQVKPGLLTRGPTPVVFIIGKDQKVVGFFVIEGRNSS